MRAFEEAKFENNKVQKTLQHKNTLKKYQTKIQIKQHLLKHVETHSINGTHKTKTKQRQKAKYNEII